MKKVLVLEDEANIRSFVVINLRRSGYEPIEADCGEMALEQLRRHPDIRVALLDVMLPDIDGFEVCRRIRASNTRIGIIMLTARSQEMDKVTGLMTGADDYVTKPFSAAELLARVRVAIRHTRSGLSNEALVNTGKFVAGDLTIDYDKHQVLIAGENCHLTQNEYRIVALLGKCAGKVLTYDFIMKELWGPQSKGSNQILRVNMANIRRKIEKNPAEPHYIFTEVGVGYRMIEGD